ncbi:MULTISPECIES: tyrosine-type recombinase/integrase [Clostridium]|jgi:integrase/recombinase XerD|uniref:Tyrosine recombinase XerD n=1 Tax=Clostridium saccharoperbutylacetonicum N1-4(HMT) TaxID=931276 RepID=M1MZN9_9CLOT|nr:MULTISPECIES: tyrosine-type recombinase/integrase [Clostridium]AGF56822.1 tyrosine recombinase XerD [Clostridium saccharoperbutylacetonicum N1-4(HMT)]AQR95482.1 tyrosine recombinase XerD [Clostridium saccharoperbutylacetonicum]NRT62421.1 integrase/recombinase XerD [Clostridium saccharoperbutylacetonicum]NSB25761.1 integrase/recombinase XerD [Clostridium saccharoperbutylacetonicum]NSB31341.1 integrase/recombinase XerD [Clostridium saccharoperbutylacetonicum]
MINCINNYKNYLFDSGKSENTIYAYVTDVSLYLKFLTKKDLDLYSSDKLTVMSYIDNLINQGKSERSINRIVISLRNFYSYLKNETLIKEVPKIEYKSTKNNRKLPQILTVEEVDKIIRIVEKDCSKGIRDNALLELMYATGMKVSELISVNVEDVNLDLNFVRCTDNRHFERLIPIGRSACKALEEYLSIRYKIAQCGVANLFVNLNGNKLTRQGIWRIVKEYSRKAGIDKDVNLNTFRHSFAVHLLQNGANVRAVQKLLGNQVLTYMDTYYEIINNDKINYIYMHTHPRA